MAKFDPNGKEMQEYPKLLYLSSGEKAIVNNAKEEAEALKDEPAKEEAPKDTKKKW